MKQIYLDHAATTPIDKIVLKEMQMCFKNSFGNASSLYSLGRKTKSIIEKSRQDVAKILEANQNEIIFTGSGTESDNLAIFGVANTYKDKGKHIIISRIEHKAVLEPAKKLEKQGFIVEYLGVDSNGLVNLSELKKKLRKDTILVSIMYANNEIGTIQPIKEIASLILDFKKRNNPKSYILNPISLPLFHTDACQVAGALNLNVDRLRVDLMTLNGSKIYGPKGVGCLYARSGIRLEPQIVGGGQEMGLRAGTENAALILGFSEALKLADKLKISEGKRVIKLRDYFIKNVIKIIPGIKLNGHPIKRLPNNINISISGIEGESLILMLDKYGISASTGSACSSSDLSPSHVLSAINISPELSHSSLRLTLGRKTTKRDVDYVLKILPVIVKRLRSISSIKWTTIKK